MVRSSGIVTSFAAMTLAATGCSRAPAPVAMPAAPPVATTIAVVPEAADSPAQAVEFDDLDAMFEVISGVYCGAEPLTPAAFATLKDLKVATVICLDGRVPDVAAAKAVGLRTVHVPVGFDDADAHAPQVIAAIRQLPGPVYLHCRYGRPRAPIVAAMVARAKDGWDQTTVDAWLRQAQVPDSYGKLRKNLANFVPPTESGTFEFPETATPDPLAAAMAALLTDWDPLRAAQQTEFADLDAARATDLSARVGRTAQRFDDLAGEAASKSHGDDFVERLRACAKSCRTLEAALLDLVKVEPEVPRTVVLEACRSINSQCGGCHRDYRN